MTKDQIVVGRGGRDYWTDIKLETLPDVSREHFRLRRDPATGQFFLKDLSRLGTTINGEKAPSQHRVRGRREARPQRGGAGAAAGAHRPGGRASSWSSEAHRMVKTDVKCAGASDPGRVRSNNEDAWHIDADRGIFLVVDGIGGQAAGEKAAEIAVERVRARLERQTGTTEQRIREAITMANNEILRAARANPEWHGHGVRADAGGAGERLGGGRARGRFAAVPDSRRRDPQDHARSFAGGRARGQSAN